MATKKPKITPVEAPTKKVGRPADVMTPEKIEAILRAVRLGLHPDRAAQANCVTPSTLRNHRKRHPGFATALKQAESEAESGFLSSIIRHTDKQWTACAWMLERRWPERWAKREPDRVEAAKVKVRAAQGPTPPAPPDLAADMQKLAKLSAEILAPQLERQRNAKASTKPD
jgi:transposase